MILNHCAFQYRIINDNVRVIFVVNKLTDEFNKILGTNIEYRWLPSFRWLVCQHWRLLRALVDNIGLIKWLPTFPCEQRYCQQSVKRKSGLLSMERRVSAMFVRILWSSCWWYFEWWLSLPVQECRAIFMLACGFYGQTYPRNLVFYDYSLKESHILFIPLCSLHVIVFIVDCDGASWTGANMTITRYNGHDVCVSICFSSIAMIVWWIGYQLSWLSSLYI